MKFTSTSLEGVIIITPKKFGDDRGVFKETYHREKFAEAGIPDVFVQDNYSRSIRGTLRGLHYQEPYGQGKLVQVLRGAVFDVAVDIRSNSTNFGKWVGVELSEENEKQLWVPPGFAHGFCTLADRTDFLYKCTNQYVPSAEHSIRWDDPDIGIDWPITDPVMSDKDASAPLLRDQTVLPVCQKAPS